MVETDSGDGPEERFNGLCSLPKLHAVPVRLLTALVIGIYSYLELA